MPGRRHHLHRTARLGLLLAAGLVALILVAEVGLRLAYERLPLRWRNILREVHVSPFTDQRMAPISVWLDDRDYQRVAPPGLVDVVQSGSPSVTFLVSTYSWWGGRVGFRSPQPQSGAIEAVTLGDSHTFCFIDVKDCWVTVLSQQTGINFSNFGQIAIGSVAIARLYETFIANPALKLGQPRLVLWQFFGNDYEDDYDLAVLNGFNKVPPAPKPPAYIPGTALETWLRQNSAVFALYDALIRGNAESMVQFYPPYFVSNNGVELDFGEPQLRASFDMTTPQHLEGERLSHDAILKARDTVEKNGGKFVVVLMPTKEEVYRPLTEPVMGRAAIDALAAPRVRLLEFCSSEKLLCLDLLPSLETQAHRNVQLFFTDDLHLNAIGNRLVASIIGTFLKAHGLAEYNP